MWTAFGMLFLIVGCAAIETEGKCGNGENGASCASSRDSIDTEAMDTEATSASLNLLQVGLSVQGKDKELQEAFEAGQQHALQEMEDQKILSNETHLALADAEDVKSGGDRRRCCWHRRRRAYCRYWWSGTAYYCPPDQASCENIDYRTSAYQHLALCAACSANKIDGGCR